MLNEKMTKLEQAVRDGYTDTLDGELESIMKDLADRDDQLTDVEMHNFGHLWLVLPRAKRVWAIQRLAHFGELRVWPAEDTCVNEDIVKALKK